jgi:hypothetical protein
MQKDVLDRLKWQQSSTNRRVFLPLAGKPQDFSSAQLATFRKSSALSRKVQQF